MSVSMFNSNDDILYTVRVTIPFLDTIFINVPPELSIPMLDTTMNIFISRYSKIPKSLISPLQVDNIFSDININKLEIDDYIYATEEYEEDKINVFLYEAIEHESNYNNLIPTDDNIIAKEDEYRGIIQDIIDHYDKYFINLNDEHNLDQMEYMIGCFEVKGGIYIKYYNYDKELGKLYMFLEN